MSKYDSNLGGRADRQVHMKLLGNTISNHDYLLLGILWFFVFVFFLMVSASNFHQPLNVVLPLCHLLLATGGTKYF